MESLEILRPLVASMNPSRIAPALEVLLGMRLVDLSLVHLSAAFEALLFSIPRETVEALLVILLWCLVAQIAVNAVASCFTVAASQCPLTVATTLFKTSLELSAFAARVGGGCNARFVDDALFVQEKCGSAPQMVVLSRNGALVWVGLTRKFAATWSDIRQQQLVLMVGDDEVVTPALV